MSQPLLSKKSAFSALFAILLTGILLATVFWIHWMTIRFLIIVFLSAFAMRYFLEHKRFSILESGWWIIGFLLVNLIFFWEGIFIVTTFIVTSFWYVLSDYFFPSAYEWLVTWAKKLGASTTDDSWATEFIAAIYFLFIPIFINLFLLAMLYER